MQRSGHRVDDLVDRAHPRDLAAEDASASSIGHHPDVKRPGSRRVPGSTRRLQELDDRIEPRVRGFLLAQSRPAHAKAERAEDRRPEHAPEPRVAAGHVGAGDSTVSIRDVAQGQPHRLAADPMDGLGAIASREDACNTGSHVVVDGERLQQLRRWIDECRLPEVAPTRQERSLRSALAMVDAGREIIGRATFDDLSVEAVCDLAGVTVGTFYCRFQSKESFFITLQRLQSFRSQAKLAEVMRRHGGGNANVDALVEDMVSLMVGHFRENFG